MLRFPLELIYLGSIFIIISVMLVGLLFITLEAPLGASSMEITNPAIIRSVHAIWIKGAPKRPFIQIEWVAFTLFVKHRWRLRRHLSLIKISPLIHIDILTKVLVLYQHKGRLKAPL